MSEIDWSKAPEGATHYGPECDQFEAAWFKVGVNGKVLCMLEENDDTFTQVVGLPFNAIARQEAWTGAGLPPVGTVCEVLHKHEWVQCEVVAHKDLGGVVHAIVWIDKDRTDQSGGIRLRPIRTQAQIEAEEREKALQEIEELITGYSYGRCAEILYQAGYRKQGEDK